MATKKAAAKKTKPEETAPLSEFQDTSKTGRVDPGAEQPEGKKSRKKVDLSDDTKQAKKAHKLQVSIEKIKVVHDHFLTITYSRVEKDGTQSHYNAASFTDRYMHQDLRSALHDLKIHLGLLSGFIKLKEVKSIANYDAELVKRFTMTGVSIKANEGVVLTGHVRTELKKVTIINAPYTLLEQNDLTGYKHLDDLNEKLTALVQEVEAYLEAKKVGQEPQGKLEFEEEPEDTYAEEDR